MTTRETKIFDNMFDIIFGAVEDQKQTSASDLVGSVVGLPKEVKDKMDAAEDLYSSLRLSRKLPKWTADTDQLLDKKKEEMDLCDTDQQLLDWANTHVFAESVRYEQATKERGPSLSSKLPLQPPTYPHLLAHLMRTFRVKYNNPHLALSLFSHAKSLSIPSYVFGCSTPAYNELLEIRWACFRDLKGVLEGLEEMEINGVPVNAGTRAVTEQVRRGVGEAYGLVPSASSSAGDEKIRGLRTLFGSKKSNREGDSGAWEMLAKIEKIMQNNTTAGRIHAKRTVSFKATVPSLSSTTTSSPSPASPALSDLQSLVNPLPTARSTALKGYESPKWDVWKEQSVVDSSAEADEDWAFDEWKSRAEEKRDREKVRGRRGGLERVRY